MGACWSSDDATLMLQCRALARKPALSLTDFEWIFPSVQRLTTLRDLTWNEQRALKRVYEKWYAQERVPPGEQWGVEHPKADPLFFLGQFTSPSLSLVVMSDGSHVVMRGD